ETCPARAMDGGSGLAAAIPDVPTSACSTTTPATPTPTLLIGPLLRRPRRGGRRRTPRSRQAITRRRPAGPALTGAQSESSYGDGGGAAARYPTPRIVSIRPSCSGPSF